MSGCAKSSGVEGGRNESAQEQQGQAQQVQARQVQGQREAQRDQGQRLVNDIIDRWKAGAPPDARAVLEQRPELRRCKSLAVSLAYEEYCLRTGAGERVSPADFCRHFPTFRKSLERLLHVHLLIGSDLAREQEPEVDWPAPGDELLDYEIVELLGRGAFARVYLAHEKSLGRRPVALKLCREGGEEADTLGKLRHPNIVSVHSVTRCGADGFTAICMPFIARATLCDVMDEVLSRGRRLTGARAILDAARLVNGESGEPAGSDDRPLLHGSYVTGVLQLISQLARGLAHAHSQGVCHLDLKPSNVLITSQGRTLLLDFNLALDRRRASSRFGGTLPYMPPEQIRLVMLGEPVESAIGARSDIFSLGVMLYELLYGLLPFGDALRVRSTGETARDLLRVQQRGAACAARKDLGGRVVAILERCLAYELTDRYSSANELAKELEAEVAWRRRCGRWLNQRRGLVAAAALILLAGSAGLAAWLASRPPYSVRQLRHAEAAYDRQQYDEALRLLDRALEADPRLTPALVLRARTLANQGDHYTALRDLKRALQQDDDPRIMAFAGYCYGKAGHHRYALLWSQTAADRGVATASVINNLGHSMVELGRPNNAKACLSVVLEKEPMLAPALYNYARAEVYVVQSNPHFPQQALDCVRRAIKAGCNSPDLYLHAAILTAVASDYDENYERECADFLRRAVAAGQSVEHLLLVERFKPILQQYPDIVNAPLGEKQGNRIDLLINPLARCSARLE